MSTASFEGAEPPADAPRSRRGQIVFPAMLIFPSLFLFVFLIYETAKLSREKIRHQFAMDAAVFVEMTNYSDFLNRTAYVNGAFPMRIFEEGYSNFKAECDMKTNHCDKEMSYAKMLFDNGAFPHVGGNYPDSLKHPPESLMPPGGRWDIRYDTARYDAKNQNPPQLDALPKSNDGSAAYELFSLDNADEYWHPYDLATEIYKLYVQIYSLLGSVEDAQLQVLTRLAAGHAFLQKSYWLNTGDPAGDAATLSASFESGFGYSDFKSVMKSACLQKLDFWGNRHLPSGIQPYVPMKTVPDVDLTDPSKFANVNCPQGGLFQIEYMDDTVLSTLKNGFTVEMPWAIPSANFFKVDFPGLMSSSYGGRELHTHISLGGDPSTDPRVWPYPTPKFQVRQNP